MKGPHIGNRILVLWLVLLLGACAERSPPDAEGQEDETTHLFIVPLNYTDQIIGTIKVNGIWAGAVMPNSMRSVTDDRSQGGVCCIRTPMVWKPGQTFTVEWEVGLEDHNIHDVLNLANRPLSNRREVALEPHGEIFLSWLWVTFLPEDEIKVFAGGHLPGSPTFPTPEYPHPLPRLPTRLIPPVTPLCKRGEPCDRSHDLIPAGPEEAQ